MVRRPIASLPLCLLLSSCLTYLGGGPPDENAMFREQQNMTWGSSDGTFCGEVFGERVRPDNLPAFIAAQEKKCAQGDAMACQDEADARLAGCGTPRDRDRSTALLRRACELGRPESCRIYADSQPAKSWWFFANGERKWAEARELELVQQLCAAGDQESCRRLEQRRRAGRASAMVSQSAKLQ